MGRRRLPNVLLRTAAAVLVLGLLAGGTALTVAVLVEVALAVVLAAVLFASQLSARMARALRVGTQNTRYAARGR